MGSIHNAAINDLQCLRRDDVLLSALLIQLDASLTK